MTYLRSFIVIYLLAGFSLLSHVASAQLPPDATSPANPSNTLVADLMAEVGSLKEQMRRLNGQLEEYDYRLRQQQEEIDLLRKELELQREDMAAAIKNGAEVAASTPTSPVTEKPVAQTVTPAVTPEEALPEAVKLPEASPAEQYKYAFSFIPKNDLASGRKALEEFVAANPGDPLVGNAKYWLGRIHLQEGRNGLAAQQLLSLIEEHPNHGKRADALVDLADALVKLGSSEDACNALAEFRRVNKGEANRLAERAARVSEDARCQ